MEVEQMEAFYPFFLSAGLMVPLVIVSLVVHFSASKPNHVILFAGITAILMLACSVMEYVMSTMHAVATNSKFYLYIYEPFFQRCIFASIVFWIITGIACFRVSFIAGMIASIVIWLPFVWMVWNLGTMSGP